MLLCECKKRIINRLDVGTGQRPREVLESGQHAGFQMMCFEINVLGKPLDRGEYLLIVVLSLQQGVIFPLFHVLFLICL